MRLKEMRDESVIKKYLRSQKTGGEYIRKTCICARYFEKELKENVLDINCGSGLFTCLLAKCNPDREFIGIDPSEENISAAKARAKGLRLDNVDFMAADINDVEPGSFDTVTSLTPLHETVGGMDPQMRYRPFDVQMEYYRKYYRDYVAAIAECIAPGGNFIGIDNNLMEMPFFGILYNFNTKGVIFQPKKIGFITINEHDRDRKRIFCGFALTRDEAYEYDELFEKWSSLAFSKGKMMSAPQADYTVATKAGQLIEGFNMYDEDGLQCLHCALYEVQNDPKNFYMFQVNNKLKYLNKYPIGRLDKARQALQDSRTSETESGYKLEELGPTS